MSEPVAVVTFDGILNRLAARFPTVVRARIHAALSEELSFSAFQRTGSFMPTRSTIGVFADEIAQAGCSAGNDTIQLPYDTPLPIELIRRMAQHTAADARDDDARWVASP